MWKYACLNAGFYFILRRAFMEIFSMVWGCYNGVMCSCDDSRVLQSKQTFVSAAGLAVLSHINCQMSIRKQCFMYSRAVKGWRTSLTQPSCISVCYSGSAISQECSARAKEKSLQKNAHRMLQKHSDDLKRPECKCVLFM